MPDFSLRTGVPDRLRVFISSTISECAQERAAARRAIVGLNFEPIQFEREGARAEPPREFYLRKLYDSHVVIGIYKNSYGWVDAEKGMVVSGLEDELREAQRLGKDFLVYVLRTDSRDPRLTTLLEQLKTGPQVLYFFEDGEDLEARIRDDLTSLVADRFTRTQDVEPEERSAERVLSSIFRENGLRVRRSALLDEVSRATSFARVVWIVGEAGAGKTALAAEWANDRKSAFVSARGLDPREVLLAAARALRIADEAELATPLFGDIRSLLVSRWKSAQHWPLVIDDPDDIEAVWPVLATCLASSSMGSVILVVRDADEKWPGTRLQVKGFSAIELDALRSIAGVQAVDTQPGDLPVTLRSETSTEAVLARFDTLPSGLREATGYIALSPAPLSLADLRKLLGPTAGSAIELADGLDGLQDLITDAPSGYGFVHETIQIRVKEMLGERAQLCALLTDRLSRRLAATNRSWAAFTLRRDDDPVLSERLANRSVREAIFTGSTRRLAEALEFLVKRYRETGERAGLLAVLLALAEVRANQGRSIEAPGLLEEALTVATEIGDDEARTEVELFTASLELRRSISPAALQRIRELRGHAEADHRSRDAARLFLEEGIAFLAINDAEQAVPAFRRARELFGSVQDKHGVKIATLNLIGSLAMTTEGIAESDRLRQTISRDEQQSPRHRAWLCNLLVPRLRREKRFAEAEALAREAIAIGEELGDKYIFALNHIVLGNVLRDVGRLDEAIETYAAGGRAAQSVGRTDIEGRSSRLLAAVENERAEAASGADRRDFAKRAEQYSTHAIGLFSNSFACAERAYAIEERGDARLLLGRDDQALRDYADAVAGYLDAVDESEAERLLRYFTARCEGKDDLPLLVARAFGENVDHQTPQSTAWVRAVIAALSRCPRTVAPDVLGLLVRGFMPGYADKFGFHCLIRCLIQADYQRASKDQALGPILLMAILAFGQYRDFSNQDLLTLAALCLGRSRDITVRHRPDRDLDVIVRMGRNDEVLFTVRTETKRPEQIFVALFAASFLGAFGSELSAILFGDGLQDGAAIDVNVFAQAAEKGRLAKFFAEGVKDKPVATARVQPNEGEEVPIIMFARSDAIIQLRAAVHQGGELELMLARLIEEILHATLGASLDDSIYASKVRDLLMAVLG